MGEAQISIENRKSKIENREEFIALEAISLWYGRHPALRDVTLHLPPGRIGLLGPNGAGKSTLITMLATLAMPSKGEIRYGDATAPLRAREPEGKVVCIAMAARLRSVETL